MEPIVLNGKELSKKIEEELKAKVEALKTKLPFVPTLATIIVGDNPASVTYVKMKKRASERVGLVSKTLSLPETTTTQELLDVIESLNNDDQICGILLQHPVPKQIDEMMCFNSIALHKDVDGVNSTGFGLYAMGRDSYKCATPLGIITLLKHYNIPLAGKNAVVIGRSAILGKPVAMLLLNENCTVTICHSKSENLPDIVKNADIVVGAVGKAKFVKKEWLKQGVVLVDAGYNEGNVGDIDLENCLSVCSAYTPVPGGVGPMTIASLISQTVDSAEKLAERYNK